MASSRAATIESPEPQERKPRQPGITLSELEEAHRAWLAEGNTKIEPIFEESVDPLGSLPEIPGYTRALVPIKHDYYQGSIAQFEHEGWMIVKIDERLLPKAGNVLMVLPNHIANARKLGNAIQTLNRLDPGAPPATLAGGWELTRSEISERPAQSLTNLISDLPETQGDIRPTAPPAN